MSVFKIPVCSLRQVCMSFSINEGVSEPSGLSGLRPRCTLFAERTAPSSGQAFVSWLNGSEKSIGPLTLQQLKGYSANSKSCIYLLLSHYIILKSNRYLNVCPFHFQTVIRVKH